MVTEMCETRHSSSGTNIPGANYDRSSNKNPPILQTTGFQHSGKGGLWHGLYLQNVLRHLVLLLWAPSSALSSDYGVRLELMTSADGTLARYFNVENGHNISSNGLEFLDLEALFVMSVRPLAGCWD